MPDQDLSRLDLTRIIGDAITEFDVARGRLPREPERKEFDSWRLRLDARQQALPDTVFDEGTDAYGGLSLFMRSSIDEFRESEPPMTGRSGGICAPQGWARQPCNRVRSGLARTVTRIVGEQAKQPSANPYLGAGRAARKIPSASRWDLSRGANVRPGCKHVDQHRPDLITS